MQKSEMAVCLTNSCEKKRLLEGFTPPCIGDTGRSRPWQYTIYEDAGSQDLYAIMRDARLPDGFEKLYASAGDLLAKIHHRGIYHGDTKPPNFVINTALPTLPPVVIVDCDHVGDRGAANKNSPQLPLL